MSTSLIAAYQFYTTKVYAYCGIFLLGTGIIGEIINLIVFCTLNIFIKNSSIFYLRLMSISNLGQIIVAVLIRTFNNGFQINLLRSSVGCKLREYFVHYFALLSFTFICLATISQFYSLKRTEQDEIRQIPYVRRVSLIVLIFWLLHNLPFLFYVEMVSGSCRNLSPMFSTYGNYFIWPVLLGCLPVFLMSLFSLLAFYNVRKFSSQQRNIIRLSHDRQITAMVLVYVLFMVILCTPCIAFSIYQLTPPYIDAEITARNRLIYGIPSFFYYESYAVSYNFVSIN